MHSPGIEPGTSAWKADILPLNYECFKALAAGKDTSHYTYTMYCMISSSPIYLVFSTAFVVQNRLPHNQSGSDNAGGYQF
jgi:hypothetical protein